MTGRIEKTVFISYRRTNFWTALAVFQNLNSNGYDVFFDYKSIPSGDFEQVITENVKSRAHFILILSPSALERCHEPRDWLRREIETAIENKRNIIPLILEGFDFGSPATVKALTGKLADLKKYNAIGIPAEYFEDAMIKLRGERFLNRSLESVSHPVSYITRQVTKAQKIAAGDALHVGQGQLSAVEWFEKGYKSTNSDEKIHCYTEFLSALEKFTPDHIGVISTISAKAYHNRGLAYQEKGDFDGAIADYDAAIRIKRDNSAVYNSRGNAHRGKKDLESALADYNEAIRLQHDFAEAYYDRGIARRDNNDLQGALLDYDEAIRLKPDDADAYCNRGKLRYASNDLQGAMSDFDEAIRLKPDDADIYYNRGQLRQLNNNLENAVQDYQEAARLKPDYFSARSSLFDILKKLGRNIEAHEQENLARELITKENEYNQACFEAICGNTDEALELLSIGLEKCQATKEWVRKDPDFESIRDDPRFQELVAD